MLDGYKSEEIKSPKSIEQEEQDKKEEEIIENLHYYKDLLFSGSLDKITSSLEWFHNSLKDVEYILEDDILVKFMEILKGDDKKMSDLVIKILADLTKFQSPMQATLFDNGLFDYIHDNYERKLLKFFINFSSTDPNFRLTLIKDRYIELIEEEFEREDAKVFELAKLCLSLVTNKVDFIECNGPKIFELFQKLSKYLVNDENAKYIIRAFLHLLTANDNFVLGFIKLGMLKPFVELEINDEDYLIGLFDLLNIICNFSEEASIYLVEHQIIEFTCYFFKNYYSDLLITKVIVLLTNLIFYIPQSIKIIQDNHITVDIINIYYEDDTKSAGFIKAVVNYCVIAMGFASSIYYHQLNAQGCYTIIVENINLIEPIYYRFTLNVILRGFPDGKPEIKKRLQDFLKENDEFIEWLEYMRSEDNVNISKLAAKILNLIYPETPIQIM